MALSSWLIALILESIDHKIETKDTEKYFIHAWIE